MFKADVVEKNEMQYLFNTLFPIKYVVCKIILKRE